MLDWLLARDAVLRALPNESKTTQATACEQASILISLANLMSFPWIRERVENNTLRLHGWYFDIARQEVLAYSADTRAFSTLHAVDNS